MMRILHGIVIWRNVGLGTDVCVYRFFVGPTARFVFKQERFEGDLRMAFIRLRNRAQDIAVVQGEEIEHVNLVDKLKVLLKYQLKVVMWHWLLSACIQVGVHNWLLMLFLTPC